jgi:hypothetical protein
MWAWQLFDECRRGLPTAALILGWSAMALGLFALGVALENRPWALKAELVRLALNVPWVWLAPVVGLWPASALGWLGLVVTACSA